MAQEGCVFSGQIVSSVSSRGGEKESMGEEGEWKVKRREGGRESKCKGERGREIIVSPERKRNRKHSNFVLIQLPATNSVPGKSSNYFHPA